MGSDGGPLEGCFGLAPLSHQREVQMTDLKVKLEFITFKNGCQGTVGFFAANRGFRNKGSISQRRRIFVVKGHFRSPFCSCEMRGEGLRNGASVPRGGFVTVKWGYGCENGIFKTLGISQSILQL